MHVSLFSPSWYKVADLRPRLRNHARIHRHIYRGKSWYVLQDLVTGKTHRFSPEAYLMIGLMNGSRTVEAIWTEVSERLGEDTPTQDEVIGLLTHLHRSDLLIADIPPEFHDMDRRYKTARRNRLMSKYGYPLAMRFSLLDPDHFLERTRFVGNLLFSTPAAMIWIALVTTALFLMAMHWSEFTENLADRVLAMENILLLWFLYPVIKVFHEFGHAYAVKRWGGEVHEMGVMLLVFMPIPYVDASSSSAFLSKYQRMGVAAAGIMVELFLAALAVIVWTLVEPGLVRTLAFNTAVIGGVTTLLFNGNPLLRFDAYYILSDFLEIPNLADRSNRFFSYLLQRHVMRREEVPSPATTHGEPFWFFVYGIAAFVYRIFLFFRIALFIASKYLLLGIIIGVWVGIWRFLLPLVRGIRSLFFSARRPGEEPNPLPFLTLILSAVLLMAVWFVPLPYRIQAEGVVWLPERCAVRAGVEGFVDSVAASSGTRLGQGEPVLVCENQELSMRVRVARARLEEFDARLRLSLTGEPIEKEILGEQIKKIKAQLHREQEQEDQLTVRTPCAGELILPDGPNLKGQFLTQGQVVGYMADNPALIVRVVVPEEDVDLIRSHLEGVKVRLVENLDTVYPAVILRQVPGVSRSLPSLALSLEGGGRFALNPESPQKRESFTKIYQFELGVENVSVNRFGERVYVLFDHGAEPLGYRWYRFFRRLVLGHLSI
ncbi:MAG: peptidase M50 [Desulfoplanes sp.]|nr:peptidase M50 [Desulfoplanes sp.]